MNVYVTKKCAKSVLTLKGIWHMSEKYQRSVDKWHVSGMGIANFRCIHATKILKKRQKYD